MTKLKSDKQLVQQALNQHQENEASSILRGLNPQQKKAVKTTDGEVVVMAGAGSGKTKVLTRRIAYLIKVKHIQPYNILAVTFTNKASQEMQQRIAKILNQQHSEVYTSTFHSLGIHILWQCAKYIPHYRSSFTIILPSSQKTLVKNIIGKELNKDTKLYQPSYFLNLISKAKESMQTSTEIAHKTATTKKEKLFQKVYVRYEKALESNNEMDFDDLIFKTVLLFKHNPEVLKYYQNKFHYISVDEFQDVSPDQYKMLMMLANQRHNLFIVGDVNQSIYSFRGSKPSLLLNFKDRHPKAKQIYMTQNYRSTKNILRVANSVIRNNKNRTKIDAYTSNSEGQKVGLYVADSGKEEANFVAQQIKVLHQQKHLPYNKFAVLYRTNIQSRLLEHAMWKYNVQYQIIGGLNFLDRKEIKDAIAYLELMFDEQQSTALERIINVPKRHIGTTSVRKLRTFANNNHMDLLPATLHIDEADNLGTAPKKKIKAFGQMIYGLRKDIHKLPLVKAIQEVLDKSQYVSTLKSNVENDVHKQISQNRLGNLKEFEDEAYDFMGQHPNIPRSLQIQQFVNYLVLHTAQDDVKDKPKVLMMTLHASKGMEFPVVFLVGMEQGILPLKHQGVIDNMEEERRLCYVGITRAEKRLYLTRTRSRFHFGQIESNDPSDFLREIPKKYLQKVVPKQPKKQPISYAKLLDKYGL